MGSYINCSLFLVLNNNYNEKLCTCDNNIKVQDYSWWVLTNTIMFFIQTKTDVRGQKHTGAFTNVSVGWRRFNILNI